LSPEAEYGQAQNRIKLGRSAAPAGVIDVGFGGAFTAHVR
jgi:hypothetical protein